MTKSRLVSAHLIVERKVANWTSKQSQRKGRTLYLLEKEKNKKKTQLEVLKAVSWVWDGVSTQLWPGLAVKLKLWSRSELALGLFLGVREGGLFSGDEISH